MIFFSISTAKFMPEEKPAPPQYAYPPPPPPPPQPAPNALPAGGAAGQANFIDNNLLSRMFELNPGHLLRN